MARLNDALSDRLTHNSGLIELTGNDYRLAKSRARRVSRICRVKRYVLVANNAEVTRDGALYQHIKWPDFAALIGRLSSLSMQSASRLGCQTSDVMQVARHSAAATKILRLIILCIYMHLLDDRE
ncbi:hypothetical protein CHELA1G11_21089 [Hyphomicrobiales bacterium]|nr:hypothetical protein CHELA1G11_21089 [Hyphomicrobiales bacterium]CAH1693253.1 hypothetical protein CHELA1G2_21397 [Hyphomicrobiales bacterium]